MPTDVRSDKSVLAPTFLKGVLSLFLYMSERGKHSGKELALATPQCHALNYSILVYPVAQTKEF